MRPETDFRALAGAAAIFLTPIVGALAAALIVLSAADAAASRLSEDRSCHIEGIETPVRCVALDRPLDPANPAAGTVRVAAVVVPSFSATPAADPLVVLAGGPGQAGSEFGRYAVLAFQNVRQSRDLILFDQRGTGRSHRLTCALSAASEAGDLDAVRRDVAACADQQPLDPRFFDLSHAIDDLDALRDAMGIESVNLWGGSYGTRTAQQYARRYGAHVRSMVLDGAIAPATRLFLTAPADAQAALDALVRDCAAQAACAHTFPSVASDLEALLDRLELAPARISLPDAVSGRVSDIVVTRAAAAEAVRAALYQPRRAAIVPLAIRRALSGDFGPLIAIQRDMIAGLSDSVAAGATLSVLCADEIPLTDMAEAAAAGTGFSGDSYFAFWSAACSAWPHAAATPGFNTPLAVDIPVLVLSGGLDPATPPARGGEVAAQFPRAWHLVAPSAGHNVSHAGCAPRLLAAFIKAADGAALDGACLRDIRRPPFVLPASEG